jgi:hypothetical protein
MSIDETASTDPQGALLPAQAEGQDAKSALLWKAGALLRSPWLTIWFRPRATMRAILDTELDRRLFLLVFLAASTQSTGDVLMSGQRGSSSKTNFRLGLSFVVTMLTVLVWAWLLGWIGRKLGGTGSTRQVRAAVAWSLVPTIALIVPEFIMRITLIVQTIGAAEAHRFSAWRALAAQALALALVAAGLLPIGIALLVALGSLSS